VYLGRGTLKNYIILLIIGILILVVIPLSAQDEAANQETITQAVDETTLIINTGEPVVDGEPEINVQAIGLSDLIRTIVVLLLVIAAIYFVMFLLKKFSTSSIDGSSLIKIVGSKGITKDTALHLVEVGNQVFLIGNGNSSINLISEITDQETIDNIRLNLSSENTEVKGSFSGILSGYLGGSKKKKTEDQIKKTETFLRNQRDRLKDL
jgi:flagellar protein FliO/FliZ